MARIHVDGAAYEVDPSQNLLHACLSHGLDIPYFCWHPALGSVGACRQCAVKQFKDEDDDKGKIVMACMTPAEDGTIISIEDEEARAFRRSVIEWLMVNHPHDCPVCDEGGECHLQDMTVMTGHAYRRFRFGKRTYRNQDLGPFINHEMNRCIQCYRCVRFYQDYAGGTDLVALAAHDHVYFGRHEDGTLESPFSGNLVEVCPTGVFTDKTLKKHYTRKWDLATAPSVCVHCSLGCNITPGERYGTLRRIRNRYHGEVNGYFLCDRGRYGYEFVNAETRIRRPLLPRGADRPAEPVSREEALERLGTLLRNREGLIGIGSPRASMESNFALKTLVGADRFFRGASPADARLTARALDILRNGGARTPSVRELERADAVLVLGEDVAQTAPVAGLALRQSVRNRTMELAGKAKVPLWNDLAVRELAQHRHGPLYLAAGGATGLDDVATHRFRAAPEDIARLGFAVAHELDPQSPAVPDLAEDMRLLAQDIAQSLRDAGRPAVVSGTGQGSEDVLAAAADAARALGRARGGPADLFLVLPECNSLGLEMLGGGTLEEAAERIERGPGDTVIVLESDPARYGAPEFVNRFLGAADHLIVLDHTAHATAARATLLLPAATFAEGDGTLVNNEGRAQRFFQVFVPGDDDVVESWRWLRDAAAAAGHGMMEDWRSLDDVLRAMAGAEPLLAGVVRAAPGAEHREAGARIPRQPLRYSGRTAMHADRRIHEPRPPDDPDSALAFTMEGYEGRPPAALNPRVWAPGWNSVQAVNRFQQEVGGALRGGDPGVRLLEPAPDGAPYSGGAPAPFTPRTDALRAIPRHHVFGSEELSMRAPGVARRAPEPYVAMHPEDASALDLEDGAPVVAGLPAGDRTAVLRLDDAIPRGTVAVPRGLPGLPDDGLAHWVRLRRGEAP